MAVLIPGKLLYLATPHTASIATTHALATLPGAETSGLQGLDDISQRFWVSHHASFLDCESYLSGGEVVVTTVRNPLDMLVTYWLRQRSAAERYLGKDVTFSDFVKSVDRVVGPTYIFNDQMFWHEVDRVLHYEHLDKELNALLGELDLPSVVLEPRNVTQGKKPWRSYYDDVTLAVAKDRFKEEMEAYDYTLL